MAGVRGKTPGARLLVAGLVAVAVNALDGVEARALGTLQHPSVEESAVGARGILARTAMSYDRPGAAPRRIWFEASENFLYGIADLRVSGLRVGFRLGTASLTAAAAQLTSGVGRETRLSLTPALQRGNRWALSVGVVHETAYVDGFAAARLTSLTVRSRIRLNRSISLGGEVDGYRLAGEANDGADAALVVVLRLVSAARISAVFDFDRRAGLHPSISMTIHGSSALRLTVGYDGATDELKGALALELAGVVCAAGVDFHPILGPRRGISLAWYR